MGRTLQRTITQDVELEGVGVHSGEPASITFRPAAEDRGITFRRVDLEGAPEIAADVDNVANAELGTTLEADGATVRTVEHALAALFGLQIDNALVDVTGPEVPIMDGSFKPFADALRRAGIVEQESEATVLDAASVLQARFGDSTYVVRPAPELQISAAIDFEHPVIGRQRRSFVVEPTTFCEEVAPARTFGFKRDADALRARGLALGASIENTIVLDEEGVMNDDLRFDDEFLRHKVGDVLGDLALLGSRIHAHIVTDRPSHAGNVALTQAIRAQIRRKSPVVADITKIMEFLPHRYPMLLVDRILEYVPGESIVGLKNVTINEPYFQGHYPGHPIMPGVLIIEAMAQCGGMLLMEEIDDPEDKVVYFMTMDNVKFRRPVTPGDQIVFELKVLQFRRNVCRIAGRGVVDGNTVAEAEFKARIMDR